MTNIPNEGIMNNYSQLCPYIKVGARVDWDTVKLLMLAANLFSIFASRSN